MESAQRPPAGRRDLERADQQAILDNLPLIAGFTPGRTVDQVLGDADRAVYAAKASRRDTDGTRAATSR